MPSTQKPTPQILLFDLGNVLMSIDFARALDHWSKFSTLPRHTLKERFQFDTQYERHERGEISGEEYFQHLANVMNLKGSIQDVEDGWNAIFCGEILPTRDLIEEVRDRAPCYAFSNTNATHKAVWEKLYRRTVAALGRIFASHEMGLRKPEAEAFKYICRETGVAPEEILFFDDLPENVEAAIALGFQGVIVRGPGDVKQALTDTGIL